MPLDTVPMVVWLTIDGPVFVHSSYRYLGSDGGIGWRNVIDVELSFGMFD